MEEKIKSVQDKLDHKFLDERKIFLWGEVDDDSACQLVERMLYLEMVDSGKEITFYINSPGGYVTSGMAIYDTLRSLKSPVSTICLGLAASMGSILLSAGTKGRRFVYPHSRVMIHQPSGGAQGTTSDIEIQTREIIKTREIGARILADNCGQPFEKVMKDFNRDYWMNCDESITYGIVDGIIGR